MSESVIHDIGYQRYTGARLGRGYALRSLFTHGLRAAFGLGRTAKAKIFPWVVIGFVSVVCIVFAIAKSQGEQVSYAELLDITSVMMLIFLAVVAPELVSRDLRNNLLPLYFSRPIKRIDYVVAKLGSLVAACWLLMAGPMTIIFFAGAFGSDSDFFVELKALMGGWGLAAVYAIIFGTLGLLIASVASRRAFAAGAIAAVFLISLPIVGITSSLAESNGNVAFGQIVGIASPITLALGIGEWLFDRSEPDIGSYGWIYGVTGAALPILCFVLLLLRYRKVSL